VNRLKTLLSHLLCFAACLPGYVRFRLTVRQVKKCQTQHALNILKTNQETAYGRAHQFEAIREWEAFSALPLTDYTAYTDSIEALMKGSKAVLTLEDVRVLQPTSGTSSACKLIPYTKSLAAEFQSALDAWLVDLYRQRPGLFGGPHYWSVSPATEVTRSQESHVPIGFLDDAEYFGTRRRWVLDNIMAVPSCVRQIADLQANQYVTLLFLLRAKELRLISVWHPSFLTILLRLMREMWPRLLDDLEQGGVAAHLKIPEAIRAELGKMLRPEPRRAAELRRLDVASPALFQKIWPRLQVISCWREGQVDREISELTEAFPGVLIQGKGLLATEGVVSIPLGRKQEHVCAVTSHVIEFQDDMGEVHSAWDLTPGQTYRIILTTAGGLYRYQLNDRVEVTGFYHTAPCLRFVGRAGVVSDCVGEKLHLEQVEASIERLKQQFQEASCFMVLVPSSEGNMRRYTLLVEASDGRSFAAMAEVLETELRKNYHYAHARELGQLQHVAIKPLAPDAQARYRDFMIGKGACAGTVKFPALCLCEGVEAYLLAGSTNVHPRG
jgi:GH3 auxin-responsive promoter